MKEVHVLLLTADACHLCDHAKAVIAEIAEEYPLEVTEIPITSLQGQSLVQRDAILIAPGIYVNGELFGYGRLSGGKLRRWLKVQQP